MAVGVTRGACKLALEAILGSIENPFAPAQSGQFLWSPEVDRRGNLKLGEIDNGQSIFEPVGHVRQPAVRRNYNGLRVVSRFETPRDERLGGIESIGKFTTWNFAKAPRQPRGVDNGKRIGFRRGHQCVAAVRREGGAVFAGVKVVNVVEHHLGNLRAGRLVPSGKRGPNYCHPMGHYPALCHTDKGTEVLGPQLRNQKVTAQRFRRLRNVPKFNRAGNENAFFHELLHRVDNQQFGDRRLVVRTEVRQDVCHVNAPSIPRKENLFGIPFGHEALDLRARSEVEKGNVVAYAVGDVQELSTPVGGEPNRAPAGFKGAADLERSGINFADRVAPGIRYVKSLSIRRNRESSWFAAHLHLRHHSLCARINCQHRAVTFTHDVNPLTVR